MKKLLFIYNSKSGKARLAKHLSEVVDIFVKSGYRVEVYPTQSPKDATAQVQKRGRGFDRIICSGGDGTLNEVITGLLKSDWYSEKMIPIGYIPTGTTNDFANSICLPKNILKAAEVAVKCPGKKLDMGSFNDRNFVYVAAFGAFIDVSYNTPQELKNIIGHQAYVVEGIKEFVPAMSNGIKIRVVANGKKFDGEFIYGMVSNSNSIGGIKGISGKNIGLNDGLFEVTLIKKPVTPHDFQEIASSFITGKSNKLVYKFKTPEVKFYSKNKVDWVVDGEFGGSVKKVTVKNHYRIVNIVTGRDFSGRHFNQNIIQNFMFN